MGNYGGMVLGVNDIITIVASIVLSVVPSIIITYLISANNIKKIVQSLTKEIINSTQSIINEMRSEMKVIINDVTYNFIAVGYAQSKASKEGGF
jgi:transcriptional regulatory protein LevR